MFWREERTRESYFINEARKFDYNIFLNPNLDFASPFNENSSKKQLYSKEAEREEEQGRFLRFFGDEERRYRQSNFHNFPLK